MTDRFGNYGDGRQHPSRCSKCGAFVAWYATTSGGRIALETVQSEAGPYVLTGMGEARMLRGGDLTSTTDVPRYMPHAGVCQVEQAERAKPKQAELFGAELVDLDEKRAARKADDPTRWAR